MRELWPAVLIAERFHVLPSTVLRSLARDPMRVDLLALALAQYADAHVAYREAGRSKDPKAVLRPWVGSRLMGYVEEYEAEMAGEAIRVMGG